MAILDPTRDTSSGGPAWSWIKYRSVLRTSHPCSFLALSCRLNLNTQMHAPRYTYLPLLIPEIRENLIELALDDQQLAEVDEKNWWFEEEVGPEPGSFAGQGVCKWYVLLLST